MRCLLFSRRVGNKGTIVDIIDIEISLWVQICIFDDLLDTHESNARPLFHLRRNAAIVNDRNFENAICKIQGNAEADLTNAEKAAVIDTPQ